MDRGARDKVEFYKVDKRFNNSTLMDDPLIKMLTFFAFWQHRTSEYHYVYRINLGNLPPRSVRLRVDIYNPVVSFRKPLRVTARFNKGTANWNVPFEMGNVRLMFSLRPYSHKIFWHIILQ